MRFFQPIQATEWRTKVAHGETVGFNSKMNKAPAGAKEKIRGWFFCRPIRGCKFFFAILPTVSPWATFCRASGAIFAALILFFAVGVAAQTNTSSDAEIQGRQMAQQLCDAKPMVNFTNAGVLSIRNNSGKQLKVSLTVETTTGTTSWKTLYSATFADKDLFVYALTVTHSPEQPTFYHSIEDNFAGHFEKDLSGSKTMIPFAASDFWLCDLGLEFFHWPAQKVLPKTTNLKRGRDYTLLESTNPNPATNGYSRVLSWIDKETGGILEAEAYDFNGKLLKDFAPKSFKKVNGQWELQEMEIRNVQTGSRTRLEFDLKK